MEYTNSSLIMLAFIPYNLPLDKNIQQFTPSLTLEKQKNIGESNIFCEIFVDLQKAFDTVEHDILLTKA